MSTRVQGIVATAQYPTGTTALTLALPSPATPGNMVTLRLTFIDTAASGLVPIATPSDANGVYETANNIVWYGNGYDGVDSFQGGGAIFYVPNCLTGTHSTTISQLGHLLYIEALLEEWSGIAASPLDQAQGFFNTTNPSTANTGTTGPLAQSNELVLGLFFMGSGAGSSNVNISDPPAGWVSDYLDNNTALEIGAEFCHKEAGSTAGQICTWTWNTEPTMIVSGQIIATFKETGSIQPIQKMYSNGQFFSTHFEEKGTAVTDGRMKLYSNGTTQILNINEIISTRANKLFANGMFLCNAYSEF